MRLRELRSRASVALRRRIPGGRALQRRLVREDLRDLRRVEPVSTAFGFDRGTPIDRRYIERFLGENAGAISGRVLEVGDSRYADVLGSASSVDVLHPEPGRGVTVVGDLETGAGIPTGAYDCIVATQVLNHIFDVATAVTALYRALAPGGILLVTAPGISPTSDFDDARWGDHWRFTGSSLRRLFATTLAASDFTVQTYGNVLAASAFLYGLAAEELTDAELAAHDPRYPVIVAVSARRA